MKRVRFVVGAAAVAASTMLATPARASAQSADPPNVDPDATAALQKMGAYLRTLNAFQVHATVSTEDVLDDGQKVQSTQEVNLVAQRPNRMRVEIKDDLQPRTFYYDGKTFTMWAPVSRFFATVDAPATIVELADQLEDKYDIDTPLVDLFRWGTPDADVKDLTSATDAGPAEVDGVTCEQYLFRQAGLDWQIWIQNGEFPLPLKVALTTTTDDARPQHESTYRWNLAPSFNDDAFVFIVPTDAKRITIAQAQTQGIAKAPRDSTTKSPEERRKPRSEQ